MAIGTVNAAFQSQVRSAAMVNSRPAEQSVQNHLHGCRDVCASVHGMRLRYTLHPSTTRAVEFYELAKFSCLVNQGKLGSKNSNLA